MPELPPTANPISKDPLANELVKLSSKIFEAGIKVYRNSFDQLRPQGYLETDASVCSAAKIGKPRTFFLARIGDGMLTSTHIESTMEDEPRLAYSIFSAYPNSSDQILK